MEEIHNLKTQEIAEYKTIATNKILFYDSIDSTNDEAKRLIRSNKFSEGAIVAEFQTAGKGTGSRKWVSQAGNSILLTVIVKPKKRLSEIQGITVEVGRLVYSVIREYLRDREVKIKLPNDILVSDKKICGILTESITHQGELYLIIGIGMNINAESFEEIEGNIPTSLYIETGMVHSRKEIVLELIRIVGAVL